MPHNWIDLVIIGYLFFIIMLTVDRSSFTRSVNTNTKFHSFLLGTNTIIHKTNFSNPDNVRERIFRSYNVPIVVNRLKKDLGKCFSKQFIIIITLL